MATEVRPTTDPTVHSADGIPPPPDPSTVPRFDRPAAPPRAPHPTIVQAFEVGTIDGRPFLVLELVPGGSLADKLAAGPLAPRAAAALARTLAAAAAAAHAAGIVHRDLKPQNVLLAA